MRINFGGLALCGLVLASSLAGCDRFRSADSLYQRGQQQYQQGNFRAALGDYRAAIERQPKHIPARLAMAQTLFFLGDFDAALTTVELAIQNGAGSDGAQLRYEILLSNGQFDEVLKGIDADNTVPEATKTLFAARAHLALGHPTEAGNALTRSLELDAKNLRAQVLQALRVADQGNPAEAAKSLDALLANNDQDAETWFARGRLAMSTGDIAGAKKALEAAERSGRRTLNWRLQGQLYALLTEVALAERDAEAAGRWLVGVNNRVGKSPVASYLSARVSLLKNDTDAAITELQRTVSSSEYPPAQLLLAGLHLNKANYGQAETLLRSLFAKSPNNIEVRKLMAQLYLSTNRAEDARKILSTEVDSTVHSVAGQGDDSQLAWLQGQSLLATGSRDAGIELLEKAVASNTKDLPKALQLARTYLLTGQAEKAKSLLESLPGPADAQRQSLLILATIAGKSREEAYKQIDSLLERNPKDSMLHAAAGAILSKAGDLRRAIQLLDKSVELDAKNLDARLGLADVLMQAHQQDRAEVQLRAVIAQDARRSAAYVGLANIAFAKGDQAQAVKQLEQAIGADPATLQPRLQLAQLALKSDDAQRAKDFLDQAIAISNNRADVISAAGQILLQARRYDDALIQFDRAAAAGDEQAPFHAARVQIALGRKENARQRLNALTTNRKFELSAVATLAAMDVEEGKADAALARLNALRDRKDIAAVQLDEIEGDIHRVSKQANKALGAYERAYRVNPSQRLAVKRFEVLATADPARAIEPLLAWLKAAPKDFIVRKILGAYYVQTAQYDKAIVEFETYLRDSPTRDAEALNNLAWLLGNKGDARALSLAREAYELEPKRVEIADTYGWLLLGANNVKEALPILESAAGVATNNPEILYHYAAAQIRDGKQAQAKTLLQDVLSKHAKFAARGDAERLLQTLN